MQPLTNVGTTPKLNGDASQAEEERTVPTATTLAGMGDERKAVFTSYSNSPDHSSRHPSFPSSPPAHDRSFDQGSLPASKQPTPESQAHIVSANLDPPVEFQSFSSNNLRKTPHVEQGSAVSSETIGEAGAARAEPWEVVRWTKLKTISNKVFSETSKRSFGYPTCLSVGAFIAIGTSKGFVLLFDYQQSIKNILGHNNTAVEYGPVLALSISADHSTVAAGHANGFVFTWDLSQPTKPFLQVSPLHNPQLSDRKADGHLADSAVLHIGFLGHRHTALVSADDKGMAFSHLTSRGLGPLGRNVTTTRLLGRYPNSPKLQTPTSVLGFAPLPLGNVTRPTDEMGLTAILTPYLLVILSTSPSAQTHFKLPRTKDFESDNAITGCLAWFPAMQLGEPRQHEIQSSSKAKLVYTWSNRLSLLEIDTCEDSENFESGRDHKLEFQPRGHWKSDEAIVAVQWINRSLIAVLTITQRLIILTDSPVRMTDSCDLNHKNIYHQDLFSRQLSKAFDNAAQDEGSSHGVIPDAYYMSFKAYKGRLFLLGADDISLGTLSNWADRLVSLMEAGNPIAAIDLATSFYNGDTDKASIGLPYDDAKRQHIVKDKILELLSGSLQYLSNDEKNRRSEKDMRSAFSELARASFSACVSIGEQAFLFDEIYEKFSDASVHDVFLYELEGYILSGKISTVPAPVLQVILALYESHGLRSRLEQILCALETNTMDIDTVSYVCLRLRLFDAFISVWNRALNDYVTPLLQLMSLEQHQLYDEETKPGYANQKVLIVTKLFTYMTYVLTGRTYPEGSEITEDISFESKASMYSCIFAENTISSTLSPINSNLAVLDELQSLNYPYLRLLLRLDCFRFMSMLNEAFEDTFLNGDQSFNKIKEGSFSRDTTINRQRIVNILLEVIKSPEFELEENIYLDIFLARNLPKFSQFVLLSVSLLRQILVELCQNPPAKLREECQLSVEYLLSTYQPPDLLEFVPLFSGAGYFRILKSTFRSSKQYAKLLEAHLEDPEDMNGIFDSIEDCLRPNSGLTKRQIQDVKSFITKNIIALAALDVSRIANCLVSYASELLEMALGCLDQESRTKFLFLRTLLEPSTPYYSSRLALTDNFYKTHVSSYVSLMCKHDIQHVAEYVGSVDLDYLDLDRILPGIDASRAVEAAILVLTRKGLVWEAMRRLIGQLNRLQMRISQPLNSPDMRSEGNERVCIDEDILDEVGRYVNIGIWLCQDASTNAKSLAVSIKHRQEGQSDPDIQSSLSPAEVLWLDLIDSVILVSQAALTEPFDNATSSNAIDVLRQVVQKLFTSLLAATSQVPDDSLAYSSDLLNQGHGSGQSPPVRFLYVLTAFIARLSSRSTSISSVRSLLSTIFSTYAFESSMLTMANTLLEKNTFIHVTEAESKRRLGWRPRSQLCEGCKRRAWGASAGLGAWEAWRQRKLLETGALIRHPGGNLYGCDGADPQKGKNKDDSGIVYHPTTEAERTQAEAAPLGEDGILVFSCSHVFHLTCFEKALSDASRSEQYHCPLCA